MLAKRAISAMVLAAAGFALVFAGGWVFTAGVALILAITGWEYGRMFCEGGYFPSLPFLVAGNLIIAVVSRYEDFQTFTLVFSILVLLAIIYHIIQFPHHPRTGGVDLAITLSGLVFVGFLGSFIVRLRFLPDGFFWLVHAIAPAGISDVGAFLIGSALGRRKLAPELSPHKSVEGYIGGVITAAISGYAAGSISGIFNPGFNGNLGLCIGSIIGVLCPLGDLGKSLIKRQFNLRNTSNLIPGHGGMLDRADTWLWAGVIGYIFATALLKK